MAYVRNYQRLVPAPKSVRTLHGLLREHLNHARMTQEDLARIWGILPSSARRLLNPRPNRRAQIKPHMLDAVVTALKLDEFDSRELHYYGALDAGYKL